MTNKMREEFEAWHLDKFCGGDERLKKCANAQDVYYFTNVQSMWVTWKASRESLAIELPRQSPYANTLGDYAKAYRQASEDYKEAIKAAGLKVRK